MNNDIVNNQHFILYVYTWKCKELFHRKIQFPELLLYPKCSQTAETSLFTQPIIKFNNIFMGHSELK